MFTVYGVKPTGQISLPIYIYIYKNKYMQWKKLAQEIEEEVAVERK